MLKSTVDHLIANFIPAARDYNNAEVALSAPTGHYRPATVMVGCRVGQHAVLRQDDPSSLQHVRQSALLHEERPAPLGLINPR
jgi:hypothetical protein